MLCAFQRLATACVQAATAVTTSTALPAGTANKPPPLLPGQRQADVFASAAVAAGRHKALAALSDLPLLRDYVYTPDCLGAGDDVEAESDQQLWAQQGGAGGSLSPTRGAEVAAAAAMAAAGGLEAGWAVDALGVPGGAGEPSLEGPDARWSGVVDTWRPDVRLVPLATGCGV